jgi:hypothetical protein
MRINETHEDKCCRGNSRIDVLSESARLLCAIYFVDLKMLFGDMPE